MSEKDKVEDVGLAYDTRGYTGDKDAYLRRLRRIEGQIRGVQKMVEENRYCIDILTQIAASTKAMHAVALGLLGDHLGHCVIFDDSCSHGSKKEKLQEANEAIARLLKL